MKITLKAKTRFNPFPNCQGILFGAPMGRHGGTLNHVDLDNVALDLDICVSKPQGEYDSGGAYWGHGGKDGPVYAVWQRGHGHDGVVYVRARSAVAAKRKALEIDDGDY